MLHRVRFAIHVDRHIVFSYAQEDFTYADALDHIQRLARDPRFQPHYRQIIDFRDVADPRTSTDEVRALARHDVFGPDSRRALVAPADVSFGLARIFDAMRELRGETSIRVVRTVEEGARWVDVDLALAESTLAGLRSAGELDR